MTQERGHVLQRFGRLDVHASPVVIHHVSTEPKRTDGPSRDEAFGKESPYPPGGEQKVKIRR